MAGGHNSVHRSPGPEGTSLGEPYCPPLRVLYHTQPLYLHTSLATGVAVSFLAVSRGGGSWAVAGQGGLAGSCLWADVLGW